MRFSYKPDNRTCPTNISFDLTDGKVYNLAFEGGCDGMHKADAVLAEGMDANELMHKMENIPCPAMKIDTSCCDQFAVALRAAKLHASIYGDN